MASSSSITNGHSCHSNGVSVQTFGELPQSDDTDPTYHARSTSLSPLPNGFSRWVLSFVPQWFISRPFLHVELYSLFPLWSSVRTPFQIHNEEIVYHLYHSGFQNGVSDIVLVIPAVYSSVGSCLLTGICRYNTGTFTPDFLRLARLKDNLRSMFTKIHTDYMPSFFHDHHFLPTWCQRHHNKVDNAEYMCL
jgi:hypothetical protein